MKWILDGAPIERLAAHRRASRDRPGYFGRINFSPDTLRALLLDACARREQPLLQAGGDSTLAVVLDLWSVAAPPGRPYACGWSTVTASPRLLARARPLGVVLVQNPTQRPDLGGATHRVRCADRHAPATGPGWRRSPDPRMFRRTVTRAKDM